MKNKKTSTKREKDKEKMYFFLEDSQGHWGVYLFLKALHMECPKTVASAVGGSPLRACESFSWVRLLKQPADNQIRDITKATRL